MFEFIAVIVDPVDPISDEEMAWVVQVAEEYGEGRNLAAVRHVRIYESAWLGDWIETVLHTSRKKLKLQYPDGIIPGAEHAWDFHLDLGALYKAFDPELGLRREDCDSQALASLMKNTPDEFQSVYGVIMRRETYDNPHCRIMLRELSETRRALFGADFEFRPRLYVIMDDGGIAFSMLD